MTNKVEYSKWIGLKKTFKNAAVMFGVPAVLYVIENWVEFVPDEYHGIAAIIAGSLAYFIKNWIENK